MSTGKGYILSQRDAVMAVFVALIFILAVVYSVFSDTTISSNINTGGTLTVSGVSTLSAATYASSTLQATGDGLFYDQLSAGASTNSPTTTFNVTGSGYFTAGLGVGNATTGTGALNITGFGVIGGRLGVVGSSTPHQELGVEGDVAFNSNATTTLSIESTGSNVGTCIELKGGRTQAGLNWVRIYVGGTGATNSPAAGTGAPAVIQAGGIGYLIVEPGRCQ